MGKTNFFLSTLPLQPLGSFSHMTAFRSFSKNTRKMSLIPVCSKTSPQVHTKSELNMLGVHGKLMKYVVHSSKRKNWKKTIFLHISCPNNSRPVFGLKDFLGISTSNCSYWERRIWERRSLMTEKIHLKIKIEKKYKFIFVEIFFQEIEYCI
jgi:hypothetical protein